MVKLNSILPFVTVLVVASVLVGAFFLVSEKLKVNAVDDQLYIKNTEYVSQHINESSGVLYIVPAVVEDQWVCFNETGDQTSLNSLFVLTNNPDASQRSELNLTTTYDDTLFNCSINSTDFAAYQTYMSMNNTEVAVGEFADWTDLLAIVLIAAVLLGILFVVFAARRAM